MISSQSVHLSSAQLGIFCVSFFIFCTKTVAQDMKICVELSQLCFSCFRTVNVWRRQAHETSIEVPQMRIVSIPSHFEVIEIGFLVQHERLFQKGPPSGGHHSALVQIAPLMMVHCKWEKNMTSQKMDSNIKLHLQCRVDASQPILPVYQHHAGSIPSLFKGLNPFSLLILIIIVIK